ncbi:MAG: hypothetical protein Q7U08_06325 [Flavobacteriaceae bacterium]|nr:hypothetical protein [Flavobacteriaceae bacterium]
MKWNNLEKDFSNKIQKRSIAPSNDSWNQLENMLTSAEKSKPKRLIFWMSVAASITGIAFIGIYMMFQNLSIEKNDALLVVQEKAVEKDSTITTDKSTKEMIINPIINLKQTTKLAEIKQNNNPKNNQETADYIDKKQENKLQSETVLAENRILENQPKPFDKVSINSQILLTSVENKEEIILKNNPIKVSASSLLSQVDGELSQTFTEKALQSIHKNYQNLKEVIASRNIKE